MSSSSFVIVGIVFCAGAILFGIGCAAVAIVERIRDRYPRYEPAPVEPLPDPVPLQWTLSLGASSDTALDRAARVDLVERLAMLGEPWCADALRDAAQEERDPEVNAAISTALARIRT